MTKENILFTMLQSLNGKSVQVDLCTAIDVPHIFENFEYSDCDDRIFFGDANGEILDFMILKNMISIDDKCNNNSYDLDEEDFRFKISNPINGMFAYIRCINLI